MRLFAVLIASSMATSMALANETSSVTESTVASADSFRDRDGRGGRGDGRGGRDDGRGGRDDGRPGGRPGGDHDGRPGGGWGGGGRPGGDHDGRPGGGWGGGGRPDHGGRPGGGWGRPIPIPIPIPVPGRNGYEAECTAAQESIGWGRTFTAIAPGRTQSEAYTNAENRVMRQCYDSSNGRYSCRIVSCRPVGYGR